MNKKKLSLLSVPIIIVLLVAGYLIRMNQRPAYSASVGDVPAFSGKAYVVINNNEPEFKDSDFTETAYEFYSELDLLGRCGYAMACIGQESMPTQERESISQVKPSGWVQAQYDCVDGENLYNRCHLIGFQLTGENANEKNLITGTRFLNVEGMLPFENMVADYIKETGNHVLYRVTPIFKNNDLVASGVQLEARSVEDKGEGICFHVYAYNNQPGVTINYADGKSTLDGKSLPAENPAETLAYILNAGSKKFHKASCAQAENISQNNRRTYTGSREALLEDGYTAAGCCNP